MTATAAPDALVLEGVTRRFGNVKALDGATLRVRAGTVHAVLGENGAGKTTLMRVAFGLIQPEAGSVQLQGLVRKFASPSDALFAGIGMVHQHFTLVPAMTVAENVALGAHGLFDAKDWASRVREIGLRTGLVLDPIARVEDLSVGAQQRCEIVKALARDVQVLILDEPTAVLAPAESQELLKWMRGFADSGGTVVLITHKLRDALGFADDITVLRHGATVLSKTVTELSEFELTSAMLGEDKNSIVEGTSPVIANTVTSNAAMVVLSAQNVSHRDSTGMLRVQNASLEVSGGEIVGIAAIEGAGQREMLRLLAGRLLPTMGTITTPSTIGFVPEDRHADALMLSESLVENVALRNAGDRRGKMPWAELRRATSDIIAEYQVRANGVDVEARTLSGGNQQKLIVGRELANAPAALVVENPTRGLDFQATAAVHDALRAARNRGTAVVIYASDLDEVLELSDRVFVMHSGVLSESTHDRDAVGRAMLGS
ncbi:MAG: ATP-binding cassette domain-containing protein [Gemmatimonadaceae bacterium]